ncbi:XdhC family protein [Brucella oryzae]|uniref:XdhC family protein n=1 Tax=Brucella oryzae TaxID=335286 RepID=A0A2S7IWN4_9HYPH|nr:XdhC family protein [Brucella oryzae]PQA72423.1 hypothetical protein C3731_16970 [Brucella oryzae]
MDGYIVTELPDPHCALSTDRAGDILRFAHNALERGHGCALVTLVEIIGGASRALGAHMAIADNGSYCGYVSGGCVEGIVAREALMALAEGRDRELRLGRGSTYFDVALPCGGGIVLSIHIIREIEPIKAVLEANKMRKVSGLTYDPQAGLLTQTACPAETGWHSGIFSRNYRPDPRILLFGRGLESDTLEKVAASLDIDTVREPIDILPDRDTAIVVLYHDLEKEFPVLRQALASEAFFIGCLGSRRTHALRCAALTEDGFSQEQIDRISAPIGLFGPARDARSLAVSILAEIMSHNRSAKTG